MVHWPSSFGCANAASASGNSAAIAIRARVIRSPRKRLAPARLPHHAALPAAVACIVAAPPSVLKLPRQFTQRAAFWGIMRAPFASNHATHVDLASSSDGELLHA